MLIFYSVKRTDEDKRSISKEEAEVTLLETGRWTVIIKQGDRVFLLSCTSKRKAPCVDLPLEGRRVRCERSLDHRLCVGVQRYSGCFVRALMESVQWERLIMQPEGPQGNSNLEVLRVRSEPQWFLQVKLEEAWSDKKEFQFVRCVPSDKCLMMLLMFSRSSHFAAEDNLVQVHKRK